MTEAKNNGVALFALAGGVVEAALIFAGLADFHETETAAYAFLIIPSAAIIGGFYFFRTLPLGPERSFFVLAICWALLPINFGGFIYYLISQGWAAP